MANQFAFSVVEVYAMLLTITTTHNPAIEGLERFVRREPLRRVHKCVFGVLALESEPLDPRL